MGNFMELNVWQLARSLAVEVYQTTRGERLSKDYGLKDQMQRSAVSIASNIAEGEQMGSNRFAVRYFYVSRGSAAELLTQLYIAKDIGYIDDEVFISLTGKCNRISGMLMNLIKSRQTVIRHIKE
jgi:four helix bundle protein